MRCRGGFAGELCLGLVVLALAVLTLGNLLDGRSAEPPARSATAMDASAAPRLWTAAGALAAAIGLCAAAQGREPALRQLAAALEKLGEESLDVRVEPRDDDDDDLRAVAEAFQRAAERLEAKLSELRDTRDYLEGVVESSADIIITVNPRGYVYSFNRGAERALGYKREEVIGRPSEMLFSDPHERARAAKRLKGVEAVADYETHLLTKGGEVRDVALTLSRLRDAKGRTIGSFGIGRDVTEANLMQKRLMQAERFAAIGQAVAGIQHALKNMLNALKGGAYMVGIGLSKDNRKLLEDGWAMVQEGITNLTAMSLHMLSYVREYKPEFERIDVVDMVRKIEGILKPTAADKGVSLTVDLRDDSPTVLCDAKLLHSALMDLLSNAIDACTEKDYEPDEKPAIRVSARPLDRGQFVVAVHDNGCGMTPDVRKHVFAPFFSTKRSMGTGLGLALTARTIRLHGGEIEVDSEPDRGSEFRIILPIDGATPKQENPDG